MATEKGKAAFDYMVKKMKADAKAKYADVAAACKRAGHAIYPIMWGRAQALLGRVKMKSRGQGKAAMRKAGPAVGTTPAGKRRGRPPGSKNKSPLMRTKASSVSGLALSSEQLGAAQALVDAVSGLALRYEGGAWMIAAS